MQVLEANQLLSDETIDLLWVQVAGVIILFMQYGFSLLESGSVRNKNRLNVLLKNCLDTIVGGLVWWAWGFGLAYGKSKGDGKIFGTKYYFGMDIEEEDQVGKMFAQFAFACTATTIVSGSVAERINLGCYMVYSLIMAGFIYPTIVSWTWGHGWLYEKGFVDFAGSCVVHMTGGFAGIVAAYFTGPRLGRFQSIRPSGDVNIPKIDNSG